MHIWRLTTRRSRCWALYHFAAVIELETETEPATETELATEVGFGFAVLVWVAFGSNFGSNFGLVAGCMENQQQRPYAH